MNSRKLYIALSVVTVLFVGFGITVLQYGSGILKKKSNDITAIKVENLALDEQQKSLIQTKKDIEKFSELESITKTIVPQEKDQARTVRELIKISNESGTKITNISFPVSTLGQAVKKPVTTQEGGDQKSGTDVQKPAQESTTPTPQTTQVKPVEGINGVYQMEISLQSDSTSPVPYESLVLFLAKLEQNRHTSQVSSLTVTPFTDNRDLVTFNIIINVYIKP